MRVAYQDQTFNTPNPIARFAHRTRLDRSLSDADNLLPAGGTLLDFGCGTGDFLSAFMAKRPDALLIGYEPFMSLESGGFNVVSDMTTVTTASVDVLVALEVLEHLTDDALSFFIHQGRRIVRAKGSIIISVPIIGGPTLLLKEANRMVLFRRTSEYSPTELLRTAFLGIPAFRPEDRLSTHKGFDFRKMLSILAKHFAIERVTYSPFQSLPWWLNSQAFFVLRKHI